jgi:hypothetical protein
MAFENRTISEVRDLLITAFQEKFNGIFRVLARSFVSILSTVLAGIFIVCYKQIGWLFLQVFPKTAYWKEVFLLGHRTRPLIEWGTLIGIGLPKNGTQWRGNVTAVVTQTETYLTTGTQLKSALNGKIYMLTETVYLDAPEVIFPVMCADIGQAGNLTIGEKLDFVNPLGNVKKTVSVSYITELAKDDETEESYRARVLQRFRMPPMGGALSDYRIWANDVSGVWGCYPQKDISTPAGVLMWVAGSPDQFEHRIPDAALLKKVGDACTYDPATGKADRKPVAAVIDPTGDGSYNNIQPVSVVFFGVKIYGLTGIEPDDFYAPCKATLDNYFLSREPYIRGLSDDNNKLNTVSRNTILSAVNQVATSLKAEFETVELIYSAAPIQSYNLVIGNLAELETLIIYSDPWPGPDAEAL